MTKAKKILTIVLFVTGAIVLLSGDYPLPDGWTIAGNKKESYFMFTDKGAGPDGKNAATIKSDPKVPQIDGFGTLKQECLPGQYLGKRIKMSGYMKTKNVKEWAGLWLRVDTREGEKDRPFDNMHDGREDRSLSGDKAWEKDSIILDVPDSAINLAYGAVLVGTGQIWFTNVTFNIVDKTVPVTGKESKANATLPEPTNLNFEK